VSTSKTRYSWQNELKSDAAEVIRAQRMTASHDAARSDFLVENGMAVFPFVTLDSVIAVTSLDDVVTAKERVVIFSAGNVSHGGFSSLMSPIRSGCEGGACFATGHLSGQ
jgi:hypothetical protein